MAKKIMILYDFEDKTTQERTNIIRKLFGFTDKSNRGNYKYERKGLLTEIQYVRKHKLALIINSNNEESVVDIFKKFDIEIIQIPYEDNEK